MANKAEGVSSGERLEGGTVSTRPSSATDTTVRTVSVGHPVETFAGNVEYILTLIGYAVGLGNIWRFPYLCYKNGGGAFLIPYWLSLFLIGLPMFFMEVSFGQFSSLGPMKIWRATPFMKGLGIATTLCNIIIGTYYCVLICWILHYFFASMTSELPWSDCGHSWNTIYCMKSEDLAQYNGTFIVNCNRTGSLLQNCTTIMKSEVKTPSAEYYYNYVLSLSPSIDEPGYVIWYLALYLLLCWIIVFAALVRGVGSLGKVSYVTTVFPYVLLTVMVVRGCTLDGAATGIKFYLQPDFSKLANSEVWCQAVTQIFFSLSVAMGGLIAFASKIDFNNNAIRVSLAVPIINCLTSFYGGFAIFSVLGYMAESKGVSVADVAKGGPGLLFVVYPEALALMPAAPFWSILFFLMMLMLGFGSMFGIAECFFCAFIDEFPELFNKTRWHNIGFRAGSCFVFYLIGLSMVTQGGIYVLDIMDIYLSVFTLGIIGLLECCTIAFIYGWSRFEDDIAMMLGKKPHIYFRICVQFISPVVLFCLILFMSFTYHPPSYSSSRKEYPEWADGIGFIFVVMTLGFIPVWWIKSIFCESNYREIGVIQAFKNSLQPTPDWGPALPANRTGRYAENINNDNNAGGDSAYGGFSDRYGDGDSVGGGSAVYDDEVLDDTEDKNWSISGSSAEGDPERFLPVSEEADDVSFRGVTPTGDNQTPVTPFDMSDLESGEEGQV